MARSPGKKKQSEKKATPPARKAAAKPAAKPAAKSAAKPTAKPAAKPAAKPPARPVAPKAATPRKSGAKDAAPGAGRRAPKKGLTRQELQRFREQLLAKQREFLDAYTNSKVDSRNRESDGTEDYIDYAVNSYDREFLLSLTEIEQTELTLVQQALARIERNQFGLCTQCEQPIPIKRLEVQPWARYCLRCQEAAEQGRGQDALDNALDEDVELTYDEELEDEVDYEEDDVDPDDEPPDAHDEDRMIGS